MSAALSSRDRACFAIGTSFRLPVLGLTLTLAAFAAGCEQGPAVDPNAPQVKAAATPDPSAPRPKGMPKNTTAGLRIDPATGRPLPPE